MSHHGSRKCHLAVIGATGSGKSSFINRVFGEPIAKEGETLKSETKDITQYKYELGDYELVIIDTPGFDDTYTSDAEVLGKLAAYLESTYRSGFKLMAVLYFHNIRREKMEGSQVRLVKFFQTMCGNKSLKNAVIVTTRWDKEDKKDAERRESELFKEYFNEMLAFGATSERHDNRVDTARAIVWKLLTNTPTTLRLQEELVNERKPIAETEAGHAVHHGLEEKVKKLEERAKQAEGIEEEKKKLEEELVNVRRQKEALEGPSPDFWGGIGKQAVETLIRQGVPFVLEQIKSKNNQVEPGEGKPIIVMPSGQGQGWYGL